MRFQQRYDLEDAAQDSSQLQESMLSILAGEDGNWVRVGDPNQAIYETYTRANPRYLREFSQRPDVQRKDLPNSGRSTQSIIELANYLVAWSSNQYPVIEVRDALAGPPFIEPVPPDDPQPNPPDDPRNVILMFKGYTPAEEVQRVADSLERWLPDNEDKIVAVLAPRNLRAEDLATELTRRKIGYIDSLLKSSARTRHSAATAGNHSPDILARAPHPVGRSLLGS